MGTIQQLQELSASKQSILSRPDLSEEAKADLLDSLTVTMGENEARLEDLGLTFQFSPSSRVFGFAAHDLVAAGAADRDVTVHNVEEYIDAVVDFALGSGIRRQMEAFRSGFNQVKFVSIFLSRDTFSFLL